MFRHYARIYNTEETCSSDAAFAFFYCYMLFLSASYVRNSYRNYWENNPRNGIVSVKARDVSGF